MSKTKTEQILSPEVQARVDERMKNAAKADFQRKLDRIPPPRDLSNEDVLFEVVDLSAHYKKSVFGEKRALHNINLSVKHGEVIYVMGRNGDGKSTLLDILAARAKDKLKVKSGKIITENKKYNLKKNALEAFIGGKKSPISHLVIWDEDDHNDQGLLGEAARERSTKNHHSYLIVTHQEIMHAFTYADRIICLHEGDIVWDDTPKETLQAFDAKKLPVRMQELIEMAVKQEGWNLELSRVALARPPVPAVFGSKG